MTVDRRITVDREKQSTEEQQWIEKNRVTEATCTGSIKLYYITVLDCKFI